MNYLSRFSRSPGNPEILRIGPSSLTASDRLARGLGWFSICLGVAELLAARPISRSLGMGEKRGAFRAYGAREVLSGILCLSPDRRLGLWSRVAGDGLDITTLAAGLSHRNSKRDNVAFALLMVGGIALLDLLAAQSVDAEHKKERGRKLDYRDRSGFPKGLAIARSSVRDALAGPR